MDNVAATFAMGVNDPTPAISGNGAAIASRPASRGKACERLASNKRSSITAQVSASSSDRLQIQHGFARLRAPIVWA